MKPGITPAMGDNGRADAAVTDSSMGSRMLGQYYADSGLTDGCYALYNNSNAERVDQVLSQLKVGGVGGGRGGSHHQSRWGGHRRQGGNVLDGFECLRVEALPT